MIALFTDFGYQGAYVGQMKAVLHGLAPGVPVVDLMHDAPVFEPRSAGYLLAAVAADFPAGSAIVAVVDPGVGTARSVLAVRADGRWFVAPDNGLLDPLSRLALDVQRWEIRWRPERLAVSFHGRDLFCPVAARLFLGEPPEAIGGHRITGSLPDVALDWPHVIYIDRFGNAVTGIRAGGVPETAAIEVGQSRLTYARTFGDVPRGSCFWYRNSSGLVELAANQAAAAERLGITTGQQVRLLMAGDRPM